MDPQKDRKFSYLQTCQHMLQNLDLAHSVRPHLLFLNPPPALCSTRNVCSSAHVAWNMLQFVWIACLSVCVGSKRGMLCNWHGTSCCCYC